MTIANNVIAVGKNFQRRDPGQSNIRQIVLFDLPNDFFFGSGEGVKWDTYVMTIYNRWGEEIFFTNSIDNPWDGTYKGAPQENGVYTWFIKAVTKDDESILRKGNITLIR